MTPALFFVFTSVLFQFVKFCFEELNLAATPDSEIVVLKGYTVLKFMCPVSEYNCCNGQPKNNYIVIFITFLKTAFFTEHFG